MGALMPAKAGIQRYLKFLDSGSPPAFAGVARNDVELIDELLQRHTRV